MYNAKSQEKVYSRLLSEVRILAKTENLVTSLKINSTRSHKSSLELSKVK